MAEPKTCRTCIYSHWDGGLWLRTLWSGFPARPTCANQPDAPGQMRECPAEICRNYRPRPPVPTGEAVKRIPLANGLYAYVDAADYEWLSQWRWRAHSSGYVARREKGKVIYMHREIMQPPPGLVVDHINGNGFDNTRANMRNVTRRENVHNKGKNIGTSSIYKGVHYHRRDRGWYAYINFHGRRFHLGAFDTEEEAARAYDRMAIELFGEHARPNLPEEWPPERRAEVHRLRPVERATGKEGKRRTASRKTRTKDGKRRTAEDKKARRSAGGKAGRTRKTHPPNRTVTKREKARR